MITHLLSQLADRAASRYAEMTTGLERIYKSSVLSDDFGDAKCARRVSGEAVGLAEAYLSYNARYVRRDIEEIAEVARRRVSRSYRSADTLNLSERARQHLDEIELYLRNEISAQASRDVSALRVSVQRAALEISIVERTRSMSRRQAQIYWLTDTQPSLDLNFIDRRGRRTPSNRFVRSAYRLSLLTVFNEIVLREVVEHGADKVAVVKVEDGVEKLIEMIRPERYSEIRLSYFHPNADRFLDVEKDYV